MTDLINELIQDCGVCPDCGEFLNTGGICSLCVQVDDTLQNIMKHFDIEEGES